MPPWIWMQARAFFMADSPPVIFAPATARSTSPTSGWSRVAPAAYTPARATSWRMNMSASMCLMAWKEPIVRPNCSRFFA